MEFRIPNDDLAEILGIEPPAFPKYTTQIMNLANQNAQDTRPSVVGQMSELIVESNARDVAGWEKWYASRKPHGIEQAADRVEEMLTNLREAITLIDRPMIEAWVKDLVISKTFLGFRLQDAILVQIGRRLRREVRRASPEEEARGIDGYIGTLPVQVKPTTYRSKRALPEVMASPIVYYEKAGSAVKADATEVAQALPR